MAKKNWIQDMHMDKGALHRKTGTPKNENIPQHKIAKLKRKKDITTKTKRQLALKDTFENMRKRRA